MYMCCRKGVGVVSGGRGSRETEGHFDREQHLEFILKLDDAISNVISYTLNDQRVIQAGVGSIQTLEAAFYEISTRNKNMAHVVHCGEISSSGGGVDDDKNNNNKSTLWGPKE
jgi:hypothetical protein